jgi:heme o synthase
VPMLPVVRGERRTTFEMLAYTLILLPLTLMPAFFGALGAFYGLAAAILGARLLWYCIQLVRGGATTAVAWRMYRYSLLYLALLFVAMGVDRAIPFGHAHEPGTVFILDHPEREIATPTGGLHGH